MCKSMLITTVYYLRIDFTQVLAYPGESIKLVILSFDEQNFTTSDTIQIFGQRVILGKVSSKA